MPSLEELQAKRDELAAVQRNIQEAQATKDGEAAEARRQAEYDRLENEIAFAKQSEAILAGVPPENNTSGTNTPPDNSTVQAPPSSPSNSFGSYNDEKDGE